MNQDFNSSQNPGCYICVIRFLDCDADYLKAWADSVKEDANIKNYDCQVEVEGGEIIIRLGTAESYMHFMSATRDGYFHDVAEFKLDSRIFKPDDPRLN